MDELALTDTLKLVYNVSKIYPDLAAAFSPAITHVLQIISHIDIPDKPLDGLLGCLLNALSILDLGEKQGKVLESSPLFPTFDQNCNVDKLIKILDQAVSSYGPEELEARLVPLLYSLITLYEIAPEGPRKRMQLLLLPESNDRSLPIGKSKTLSSTLLKFSTSHFVNLKVAISELMFVLSEKDPELFTKNIGYGFAAGFLAARGIKMPQSASETYSTTTDADSLLNPITGQKLAAEPKDDLPPMTQEEKEREAERLFVLFERYVYRNSTLKHRAKLILTTGRGRMVYSTLKTPLSRLSTKEDLRSSQTMLTVIEETDKQKSIHEGKMLGNTCFQPVATRFHPVRS